MLPLLLLVYTPKGNIAIVSEHLRQHSFLLVHPTLPSDQIRVEGGHYLNPHDLIHSGWSWPGFASPRVRGFRIGPQGPQ